MDNRESIIMGLEIVLKSFQPDEISARQIKEAISYLSPEPPEVKTERGKKLVNILMLRKDSSGVDRYRTEWGSKTALGIYETVKSIIEGDD